MIPSIRQWFVAAVLLLVAAAAPGCLKAAATLTLTPSAETPIDARVTIDEEFIGTLGFVASRGVRLPAGEHRVSVEREGYFPFDDIVVSQGDPIPLQVSLRRLPE